jgi:hypothetical protein
LQKDIFATDVGGAKNREVSQIEARKYVFTKAKPPEDLGLPSNWENNISPDKIIGYFDGINCELHLNQ